MTTIARVEAFPLRYPEPHDSNRTRHVTLARLETADGAVGWGECVANPVETALAVKVVIDAGLAKLLVGEDPRDPQRLWHRMRNHGFWHGHGGILSFAISALDMAVWDLAGKVAGLPVHRLLGGKLQDRVRACSSVILNTLDLDALAEEFADYRKRGFTAMKGGWGQVAEAGFGTDSARDLRIAATLREAIGPEVSLAFDVSAFAAWSSSHAVTMAKRLEEFDLGWLEDPLHHEDHDGYRRIRSAVSTRIATGERCWTPHDYARLVRSGSVDLILVDPGRVDGISGTKAVVEDAAGQGVGWVPHSWSSAINTAAALAVFASSSNGHVFEIKPNPSPMQHELVTDPFEQENGWIEVRDEPGLGVTVDEDVVRSYGFTG
ncbi:MAG: mandelate racemase/muconate lactonizing enzyme family protein [Gaiella sp.]